MSSCGRILLFFALVFHLVAHDGLEEQILRVTQQIRQDPRNASLYFQRAELERADHRWNEAVVDYGKAQRLNPALDMALLGEALSLLAAHNPGAACPAFDRFLTRSPAHPDALIGRARCREMLGRTDDAVRDYTAALGIIKRPKPEYFLERSEVLINHKRPVEALDGLDEGIRLLGPLVTLELPAIEIDVQLGRHQDALKRLTYFVESSARKETWLARRAEVLEKAGNPAAARLDRAAAVRAIGTLPEYRRSDKSTIQLLNSLRAKL